MHRSIIYFAVLIGLASFLFYAIRTIVKRSPRLRAVSNRFTRKDKRQSDLRRLNKHELRNYQTAIAANLEYVEASGHLPPDPRQALTEAQDAQRAQAELLKRTIDDLRGRSSGGTGTFLLRSALEDVAALERQVKLRVTADWEYELSGNVEHLRVILLNLTRNAMQAGAKQVECHLRGEASGTAVRLTVSDDGTGIVQEKRARLFDSFALSEKPGGSGLGLYLTRRYVELLGGAIELGQESSLGGASFVIRLPARAVAQSRTQLQPILT